MMQRPTNKAAPIVLAAVLLMPVVYVLSVGPAFWYVPANSIDDNPLEWFYRPLVWASDHSTVCQSALNRYIRLWGPDVIETSYDPAP